jgi:hypothetical protein
MLPRPGVTHVVSADLVASAAAGRMECERKMPCLPLPGARPIKRRRGRINHVSGESIAATPALRAKLDVALIVRAGSKNEALARFAVYGNFQILLGGRSMDTQGPDTGAKVASAFKNFVRACSQSFLVL